MAWTFWVHFVLGKMAFLSLEKSAEALLSLEKPAFLSFEKPAGRFWCPDLSLGLHPARQTRVQDSPRIINSLFWGKSIQQPAGVAGRQLLKGD